MNPEAKHESGQSMDSLEHHLYVAHCAIFEARGQWHTQRDALRNLNQSYMQLAEQHKQALFQQSQLTNQVLELKLQLEKERGHAAGQEQGLTKLEARTGHTVQEHEGKVDRSEPELIKGKTEFESGKVELAKTRQSRLAIATKRLENKDSALNKPDDSSRVAKGRGTRQIRRRYG